MAATKLSGAVVEVAGGWAVVYERPAGREWLVAHRGRLLLTTTPQDRTVWATMDEALAARARA